jgi:hypothetical protein
MAKCNKSAQAVPLHELVGREWVTVINGKRALNGPRHSITVQGTVEAGDGDETIYDVLRQLVDHIEENTTEMEYPDSIRVTILPPNSVYS